MRFFLLFFAFSLFSEEIAVVENLAKVPLLFPGGDKIETRKLRLQNGIHLYLVSDPKAPLDSVAMTVLTGSYDDPEDFPGLAHFVEHLLFLGSKNYPAEDGLDRFLSLHGGRTNAFTASDITTYFFTIESAALEEGLTRFSDQFRAPLFPADLLEKEKIAVDEEFRKNLTSQDALVYHLLKEATRKEHPFSRFCTGNLATLKKVDQNLVRAWFSEHYQPSRMRLYIRSVKKIEALEALAVRFFSPLQGEKTKEEAAPLQGDVFEAPFTEKVILAPSKNGNEALYLIFSIPRRLELKAQFLSDLLESPQKGAFLSSLKVDGLLQEAGVSIWPMDKERSFLLIDFVLTEKGVAFYDEVIQRLFSYLSHLRKCKGLSNHFEEAKKKALLEYQFSWIDPMTWGAHVGSLTKEIPFSHFPEPMLISAAYEEERFFELVDLLKKSRPLKILSFREVEKKNLLDRPLKWFETSYTLINEKSSENQVVHLFQEVETNPFLPQSFDLLHESSFEELPELILEEKRGHLYYAKTTLGYPEVYISLLIKSPSFLTKTKKRQAALLLYKKWLEEELFFEIEMAKKAGLSFESTLTDRGLVLRVSGFSDKAALFVEHLLTNLKKKSIDPLLFASALSRLKNEFSAFFKEPLYAQVKDRFVSVLFPEYPTKHGLKKAILKLNYEEFSSFVGTLYSSVSLEGLILGNLGQAEAEKIFNDALDALSKKSLSSRKPPRKELALAAGGIPLRIRSSLNEGGSSLSCLLIETKENSPKARALGELAGSLVRTPFFRELRTKQQTGYAVFAQFQEIEGRLFHLFMIQSSGFSPEELGWRTEIFLKEWLSSLDVEVDEEQFLQAKSALLEKYQKEPTTLVEFGSKMERLAFYYEADFLRERHLIEALKNLTREDFLEFAHNTFGRINGRRVRLEMAPNKAGLFTYDETKPSYERSVR